MITIDIETISGVPLTGELKAPRPTTSATTRKLSRKDDGCCHGKQAMNDAGDDMFKHSGLVTLSPLAGRGSASSLAPLSCHFTE